MGKKPRSIYLDHTLGQCIRHSRYSFHHQQLHGCRFHADIHILWERKTLKFQTHDVWKWSCPPFPRDPIWCHDCHLKSFFYMNIVKEQGKCRKRPSGCQPVVGKTKDVAFWDLRSAADHEFCMQKVKVPSLQIKDKGWEHRLCAGE